MRQFCFICSSTINSLNDLGQLSLAVMDCTPTSMKLPGVLIPGKTETEEYKSVHLLRTKIHLGQYLAVQSGCLDYNRQEIMTGLLTTLLQLSVAQ